ncbi:MAG: energy-coupling factor transporter transmembrane protein EcfT [Syntrophaceae bacterium]|nr:energy-coupling factor transporter transmembrane protein EcfT [Syntrophaceae bacterium]
MADRIAFHYFPANSPLHRWDARCKFFGLLIVTVTLLQSKISWLILDSVILLSLLTVSGLSLIRFIRDLRTWGFLLFILFLFQTLFTPGRPLPLLPWLPISAEGFNLGILTFWRLGLILGFSILFTAVTRPRELRDTLVWLLKPLPFLPARRIGLMVSLTLRFFSLILDQSEEVRLAHKARSGDRNKNPLRRAKFLGLPILRRSFSQAEDVAFALAARGYRDDIPLQLPKLKLTHLTPLLILFGLLMITR